VAEAARWELEIRLLGELEISRPGNPPALLPLSAALSRKTRALLAYLVASGRPQSRRAICELLWEGPDDPRGALRWSLSRLRRALGPDRARIEAIQDRLGFRPEGVRVDWHAVRDLLGRDVEQAPTPVLRAAASELRGEFLAGLDLEDCFRFGAWCAGEREAARTLRLRVLRTLVDRLTEHPDEALLHARSWTAVDPLGDAGHATLIRLLGALGRHREALDHYGHCRRMFEVEAGVPPSREIELARMSLRAVPSEPPARAAPAPGPPTAPIGLPLVGRRDERATLEQQLAAAATGQQDGLILLSGEAGIGKTRLATWLAQRAHERGGRALTGRGFEAETGRPFGAWIDLLGGLPADDIAAPLRPELARLLPQLGPAGSQEGDRARLFDAVVALLRALARPAPLVLLFDDLQWADDASLTLLHFVIRSLAGAENTLLVATARSGELADSPAAARLVRELGRARRLRELRLGPLPAEDVRALTVAAYPSADPAPVLAQAEGNPLFALEAARALTQGIAEIGSTLDQLVAAHLGRLGEEARRLLPWAAAIGRTFSTELLARACAMAPSELDAAIAELELHAVLEVAPDGGSRFVHDTYRRAAYYQLSEPRRRLVHLQIARCLAALEDPDGDGAADLARHAALGGDPLLAARACLAAGQRCLRLFAAGDARTMSERGLHHIAGSAAPTHVALRAQLLRLQVLAGAHRAPPTALHDPAAALEEALALAVTEAGAIGAHEAAAVGHHALSVLYQERGALTRAQEHTLAAEAAGRVAGAATSARQQANTARCLVQLQRDLPHARQLLARANAVATRFLLEDAELHWAAGLLHAWDGEHDLAVDRLQRGLALALALGDRHREHGFRVSLVLVELDRRAPLTAQARCRELAPLAALMGTAEQAHAEALDALARAAPGDPLPPIFDDALDRLRAADSKAPLAYLLAAAAAHEVERGESRAAQALATEGADLADELGLGNEAARARAVLARAALTRGEAAAAHDRLARLLQGSVDPDALSARCRDELREAVQRAGLPTLTPAHTGRG
jgi:DNA-binding SARP family transcriptional activator